MADVVVTRNKVSMIVYVIKQAPKREHILPHVQHLANSKHLSRNIALIQEMC
jgi:hypothetical protein